MCRRCEVPYYISNLNLNTAVSARVRPSEVMLCALLPLETTAMKSIERSCGSGEGRGWRRGTNGGYFVHQALFNGGALSHLIPISPVLSCPSSAKKRKVARSDGAKTVAHQQCAPVGNQLLRHKKYKMNLIWDFLASFKLPSTANMLWESRDGLRSEAYSSLAGHDVGNCSASQKQRCLK